MLLRYNPPRAERARGGVYGDIGSAEEAEELLAVRTCWSQPQLGKNVAEGAKRMARVRRRRREKREATRRNGYEEIPPPVIPP